MIRRIVLTAAAVSSLTAAASDPLGYARLRSELGAQLADGSSVIVGQVEPPSVMLDEPKESKRRSHVPQAGAAFDGVRFHHIDENTPRGSRHATATAKRFYGRQLSLSPGVRDVHLYTANAFLRKLATSATWPPVRVWSHSWVGASGGSDRELLRALDAAIERHDWIVAVGVVNRGATKPLLASAFNVLSVGTSDGGHTSGPAAPVDNLYDDRRQRPHLVAPATRSSMATPQVASAAVVLLETLPPNLQRSLLVRAALMAGAARRFDRSVDPDARAQPDYRAAATVRTNNGLDTRFGAGQLNIYNSYKIVTGPRRRSVEAAPDAAPVTASGFDYETNLFDLADPDRQVRYRIVAQGDQTLTAALIWSAQGGRHARLPDLDLQLFAVSDTRTLLVESASGQDTGEHVRASLSDGARYELVVTARTRAALRTAYALAWRLDTR